MPTTSPQSAFSLDARDKYSLWRDKKLHNFSKSISELVVEYKDPLAISSNEKQKTKEIISKFNMCIYQTDQKHNPDKAIPQSIGEQFGLYCLDKHLCADDDGIAPLTVGKRDHHQDYIPYTDRPINWHTDGYYNSSSEKINTVILHCVNAAQEGGANQLMDHELMYILLREQNPDFIRALMSEDVMVIPENIENDVLIRDKRSGPVFSIDMRTQRLHMRYTARTRSIQWKQNAIVKQATQAITELLQTSPYVIEHRLEPGQGLLSRNVLHTRRAFVDGNSATTKRLIFRARYYDSLA